MNRRLHVFHAVEDRNPEYVGIAHSRAGALALADLHADGLVRGIPQSDWETNRAAGGNCLFPPYPSQLQTSTDDWFGVDGWYYALGELEDQQ